MAPQTLAGDLSDTMEKSEKELLHEELQSQLARVLKACTKHVSYALPKPQFLDEDQGTEDANVMKSYETVDEIITIATSQIEALRWDLVGELLNPGTVVTQAFKKACYLRYQHLSNSDAPSLLALAQNIEQKDKLKEKGSGVRGDNDVELKLPVVGKKRKSLVFQTRDPSGMPGQGLFGSSPLSSPVSNGTVANPLADESLLKKIHEMTVEEMATELKQRGLRYSGIKADLISRLKAGRFDAYHPEDAAWANGLTDGQLVKVAKQSAVDMPKLESREKLKVYLYENPGVKAELKTELEEPRKIRKRSEPVAEKPYRRRGNSNPVGNERPKLVTTTEVPRYQRRLILFNFPSHTTERDIKTLMAKYGGLLPIKQGPGEFIVDCDTAADAKQAIAEVGFQLVEGNLCRCVLESTYLQEKKKLAAIAKSKNKAESGPEGEKSAKKVKKE